MDVPITRAEHNEFVRRMEIENKRLSDEDDRQNQRINKLEDEVRQIGDLTISVEKLAISTENMVKEQREQGKRLQALESRDGEMWRKVTGYIITAIIGIILGFIFTQMGFK